MPKIPARTLDIVCYLYPTRADAAAGENFGGTGFLVAIPSEADPTKSFVYVVSNWHVACRGCPVVRINRLDGGVDVFDFKCSDWIFDKDVGADVATVPIALDINIHQFFTVDIEALLSREVADASEIGPGDDVFMIGRFVDHDGGTVNRPAARFGNISINPTPLLMETGKRAEAYCIDLHSRSGYSGSPVFVYRTPGYDLGHMLGADGGPPKLLAAGTNFFALLGIHFGQFPELWEVTSAGKLNHDAAREPLLTDGKFIRGLSGMTCVVPAWIIAALLNLPVFVEQRSQTNRLLAAQTLPTSAP